MVPYRKFLRVDTRFWKESTYENEIIDTLSLTENSVFKEEMENHDNFKHYIGWI